MIRYCFYFLLVSGTVGAVDQVQFYRAKAFAFAVGRDGTLYAGGAGTLKRTDPITGATTVMANLSGDPHAMAVADDGSVCVAGDGISVACYSAAGTLKFSRVVGNSSGAGVTALAFGPNGSIYATGYARPQGFPVTIDGFVTQDYYALSGTVFFQLSGDGTQLLYSTFLGSPYASGNGASMAVDAAGNAYLAAGNATGLIPISPGASTELGSGGYVARWSPIQRRFDYVAQAGSGRVQVAVDAQGRAVIANAQTIAMLDTTGSRVLWTSRLPFPLAEGSLSVWGLAVDSGGNVIVAGDPQQMGFTVNAPAMAGSAAAITVAKLSSTGDRLIYATPVVADSAGSMLAIEGRIFIVGYLGSGGALLTKPVPLSTEPAAIDRRSIDRRSMFMALPKVAEQCGNQAASTGLYWDTRDTTVTAVEVRSGGPGGTLVASGLTGSVALKPVDGATYYMQDVSAGQPGRTLAIEQVRVVRPLHCSGVPNSEGSLLATPNPVVACEASRTGPDVQFWAQGSYREGDAGEYGIRVGTSGGPLFTQGRYTLTGLTGLWVRNAMDFFLTVPTTTGFRTLASERVFVLPIRDCYKDTPAPPRMTANPPVVKPCGGQKATTLAFYTGLSGTEIRQGAPDGPVVGRFNTPQGLLDVTPAYNQVYYLFGYRNGEWVELDGLTVSADRTGCDMMASQ